MQAKASQRQSSQTEQRAVQAQPGFTGLRRAGLDGFADTLLSLQRSHGNRFVQRLLEATVLQRGCGCGGTCPACSSKQVEQNDLGGFNDLHRKPAVQQESFSAPSVVNEVLSSPGQPLDASARAFMEPRFGRDFQHVRIHTDSKASESAKASAPGENRTGMPDPLKAGLEQLSGLDMSDTRVHFNSAKPAQLNALAYTQGKDIEVGPGQERHLPHEGWHVVQQMKGRVKPTLQAKGVSINDAAALEREADVMGAKALQMTSRDQVTLGSTLLQRREEAVSSFRVQVAGLTTSPPQSAIPAIQRRVKPDRAIDPEGLNVVGEFHSESEARSKAPIGETPEEKAKVWYTPDEKLPKKDESDRLGGEYGDPPHYG